MTVNILIHHFYFGAVFAAIFAARNDINPILGINFLLNTVTTEKGTEMR
jgi:hypothetical protein